MLLLLLLIWVSPPRASFKLNIPEINTPWSGHKIFRDINETKPQYCVCAVTALNKSEDSGFYIFDNYNNTMLEKFVVKGIGYSPTPIGMEPSDFYIAKYRYLYLNDIPIIASMNANVIRLWEWNFQADHEEFLTLLSQNNLQVLIPFQFTKQFYPTLSNESDVRKILLDFTTLVSKTIRYPMVLGYLIGNELNIEYDGFMDQLFPIVNQLATIVKEQDTNRTCPHLVMLPLSESNFLELVTKYNKFVNFTNWALQAYNSDLTGVISAYLNITQDRPLPLLFTEFGADAFTYSNSTANSTVFEEYIKDDFPYFNVNGTIRQEAVLYNMWNTITNYTSGIAGGVIMEFVDEWWKGNEVDMIDIGCPNTNLDVHSGCGSQTDDVFIHEEYLGIFGQDNSTIDQGSYCIYPRLAYYNLSSIWGGITNSSMIDESLFCRYYVGIFDPPFIYVEILLFCIFFLLLIGCAMIAYTLSSFRREMKEYSNSKSKKKNLLYHDRKLGDQMEETIIHQINAAFKKLLQSSSYAEIGDVAGGGGGGGGIAASLEIAEFILPEKYYAVRDRIVRQILDYTDQGFNLEKAYQYCYLRTLEGYFLWTGQKFDTFPSDILDRLALWCIVYSESGTIAHCPNMLYAIYHYYLPSFSSPSSKKNNQNTPLHSSSSSRNKNGGASSSSQPSSSSSLSKSLESIYSYYAEQIDRHQFSFDDINYNGLKRQPRNILRIIRSIFKATPFLRCATSASPFDPYSTTESAKRFISSYPLQTCFNFRRNWITALCTLLFNLTWLLRIDGWMMFSSWYLQPTVFADEYDHFIIYLTFFDATLLLFSTTSQLLIWRSHYEIRHFLVLVWRVIMMVYALDCIRSTSPNYLYLALILWVLCEIYFALSRLVTTYTEGHLRSKMKLSESWERFYKWILSLLSPIGSILLGEILFYYVLIPSFDGVNQSLCDCPLDGFLNSPEQTYICSLPARVSCYGGFILVWLSSIIVSIIFLYAAYIGLMLFIGIVAAKRQSIGTFITWDDLTSEKWSELEYYGEIFYRDQYARIWDKFIDSLIADWVISPEEGSLLRLKDFDRPPICFEARRRILSFANSWYAICTSDVLSSLPRSFTPSMLIQHMPSFSTLIPVYNETILYDTMFLRSHSQDQPISNFEYLVNTYPIEWSNFCLDLFGNVKDTFQGKPIHRIIANGFQTSDYAEMWKVYLSSQVGEKESQQERIKKWEWRIRVWASCHGQTLSRTLRGLANLRYGLTILDPNIDRIRRKFQVVVSYQTFERLADREKHELRDLQAILGFDLAYPSNEKRGSFNSCYERDSSSKISPVTSMLNRPSETNPPTIITVPRPSGFPIGEGKAENQIQALPFALGSIFQALDMNQYFSLENAFFIPFALYTNYSNTQENMISPKYRVLGFPEYTYSRPLSAVGEYMGLAEFAFVTIIQRVLSVLQVRLHYGHPDYFDGYWVYYRGGPSKSTKVVNVNEDIFAGYEVIQRGEKIGYVEYFQGQKGRESGFNAATVFLTKLAQGAAQQVLSKDVYVINETFPVLERFTIFFGSLGFYVITYFMVFSIFCYLFSLTFFAIAGVSYHQLGLVGSAIAVPWIIQVGFIQMFPVLIEVMIEDGFWNGLIHFLIHLPLMLLFFLFQIKTTAYHFQYGLTMGRGGYKSTGRGFELTRSSIKQMLQRYTKSHFISALLLLFGVLLYFTVTSEAFITAIIRMWSIELIIFSWLLAPVVFNPFPNSVALARDFTECLRWIQTPFPLSYNISNFANKIWPKPPNKELPEEKMLKSLQDEHAETSWEFSFWTQLFEESLIVTSSQNEGFRGYLSFILDMSLTFGQWVLFILIPVYGMIALTLIKLWSPDTLPILMLFIAFILLYLLTQELLTGRARGLIAGIIIVTLILCTVYWIFSIRSISFLELLLSLILDLVVIYLIDSIFRGLAYFIICYFIRHKFIRGYHIKAKIYQREKTCFHLIYVRDIIRFVSQAPKAFPIIIIMILYLAHVITSWCSSTLMTILYNSRLTHRWRNFEVHSDNFGAGIETRIKATHSLPPKSKKLDVIISTFGIEIDQLDLASLSGVEWLTDQIINSLVYRHRYSVGPSQDWIFIQCDIARYLIEAKECQKLCNLPYKCILLPLPCYDRRSAHTFWSMMICDMDNLKCCHFDSSENPRNEATAISIATQMNLVLQRIEGGWIQDTDYNCGIRILQIVKLFSHISRIIEMNNFEAMMAELTKFLSNRADKTDEDRRELENGLYVEIQNEVSKQHEYLERKSELIKVQLEELEHQQQSSLEIDRKKLRALANGDQPGCLASVYRLQDAVSTTRSFVLGALKDKNIPLVTILTKVDDLLKELKNEREVDYVLNPKDNDEREDVLQDKIRQITIMFEEVEILQRIIDKN